jgi:hypothetical protein
LQEQYKKKTTCRDKKDEGAYAAHLANSQKESFRYRRIKEARVCMFRNSSVRGEGPRGTLHNSRKDEDQKVLYITERARIKKYCTYSYMKKRMRTRKCGIYMTEWMKTGSTIHT